MLLDSGNAKSIGIEGKFPAATGNLVPALLFESLLVLEEPEFVGPQL